MVPPLSLRLKGNMTDVLTTIAIVGFWAVAFLIAFSGVVQLSRIADALNNIATRGAQHIQPNRKQMATKGVPPRPVQPRKPE